MPIANIYVIDDIQEYQGEPIHNIYTYKSDGTGTAVDVGNSFEQDILPKVLQLQCSQIHHVSLKTYSLSTALPVDERNLDMFGANVGVEMLPIFNAINFSVKPTNRIVRAGSKRYAGVPETVQVDGVITASVYLTAMETLRLALAGSISDDDVIFFEPVIVKRVKYDVPDSSPVRQAYRFPETDAELVTATIGGVTVNRKVSHQVSRGN